MTPEEMTAKMMVLYEDEEFTAKAAACENTQQMAALFVAEGLPVTPEILNELLIKVNEDAELGEAELETVSGGIRWHPFPFPIPFPIPRPRPRWPFGPKRPRGW